MNWGWSNWGRAITAPTSQRLQAQRLGRICGRNSGCIEDALAMRPRTTASAPKRLRGPQRRDRLAAIRAAARLGPSARRMTTAGRRADRIAIRGAGSAATGHPTPRPRPMSDPGDDEDLMACATTPDWRMHADRGDLSDPRRDSCAARSGRGERILPCRLPARFGTLERYLGRRPAGGGRRCARPRPAWRPPRQGPLRLLRRSGPGATILANGRGADLVCTAINIRRISALRTAQGQTRRPWGRW